MAKDPQKQPPTGDQPDAGGGAELPPWLRGDPEPSKNEAPATPPASASSLPRLSNRKDAPAAGAPSADDESVPPWLRGLPPPEQKTFMIGGTEVSREFFDDAESIPETENSSLTYDQWLANQIEDKREKSVEEELPDIFGTNTPTPPVNELKPNRPQPGTPGVTGQLPDWFLGLEELDTADAPEWFKQMEAGNTGLLKEPPKPPTKEDKPPKWLNDQTPPPSPKPSEPAAKKSDPIDDFFQSIGTSFDAPTSENWESESEVPGDDFFAELVGKKPAAPPPPPDPQVASDFDVSNLEADDDLPDLGWVTGPLSQSQFDLGEQAQTRSLFEGDAEQDASAPGLFNPRSGGATMRFDTEDDDPPVGGATMRFDTDDDDPPVGGATMRFDTDDDDPPVGGATMRFDTDDDDPPVGGVTMRFDTEENDDLPFNAPSGGLTDLFEARKEGVTIRFDSDDYEEDTPSGNPAVEIPQYELDAFLEGLDDVGMSTAELAAIEDPDMDFIFTPPATPAPVSESWDDVNTPTTSGSYTDSTLDWLSQIDSMVDSVTHVLDPNTVGDRHQPPTGTALPQVPEDDDFDFASTSDQRTTRGGTSSDDGFNWGDVATPAIDPEPEAEGSDWLNDIDPVDDTPYEAATTPIDLAALGVSSMLNRNRQPRQEEQAFQDAAPVNEPAEDDLFNLTGLAPSAFGEQPAASEIAPYDGPTDWEQIVQSSRPLSEDDDDDFMSFVTADPATGASAARPPQDDTTHDDWLMDNLLQEADALDADAGDWAASALSAEDAANDADFLTLIDRGSSTAQPLASGYDPSLQDDLFALAPQFDTDELNTPALERPNGEAADSAYPDFMFGDGGTNTDDDLFSLTAPQASAASDDDDLFASLSSDHDLFSPVSSQLPDSGELPDFMFGDDQADLFASPSAQPSYENERLPDFLRDSAPLASPDTTTDVDDLFALFGTDEAATGFGDLMSPKSEPRLFDPFETQSVRGLLDDTQAPSPDQDAAQAHEAMQDDFFASLGLDMDDDTTPTQNVVVPAEDLYGVESLFSSLNDPDPEPITPDPEALAFGAGWDDSWGTEDTTDPMQSTGVTGLGAGLDWANEFADESDQQVRADQIQAFVDNRPQEKPRSSNPVFEDIDDYLSSLDPTAPPISKQTGAAFSQPGAFDIDALLDQEVPTERREAASPFTMSDGSSLESAQEDWLRQMGGSVNDMSAAAMVRQKQDRPVEELPERLRKLRERAEQIPNEADSAPNTALSSVLPGVTTGLGSAAPFTTGAPAIDQNVAIPPEQQARIALLQSLAGVVDVPERMTAIELTYDSPFMKDLEDDEENIVRTTTEERAVSVATVDRPRRRRLRVQVDRLLIAALLALAMFLPFIVPALRIGDPPPSVFAADSLQAAAFAQVNALRRDDLVLLAVEYQPGSAGELDGMTEAILRHVLLRGASPVIISGNPLALMRSESQMAAINADDEFIARLNVQQPLERNYEYFITRFLPGGIIGLRAFSQDTANLLTTDIRGQTTNLYIDSIDEFDLVVVISDNGEILRNYAEQVAPYASAPFVAAASYGAAPLIEPYAQSAAVDGLWVGYGDSLTYAGLLDGVTAVRRGERRVITPPPTPIPATPAPSAAEDAGRAGAGAEATPEATEGVDTPAGETNSASTGLFAVVSSNARVNMRSGAGTNFSVVTSVAPGTRLEVLGASEDTSWANVRLENGSEGWISSQLLEIELAPTATPRNKPRPDQLPDVAKQEIDDSTATPAARQPTRTPLTSRTPIPSRTLATAEPEGTRTARPTVDATETGINTATVEVTLTASPTATLTATATEVDADSTPEIVPTPAPLVFSAGMRQERWYGLQLGIIVSVLIISTGAVVNIGRGLFRRLRISRKRR